MDGSPMAIRVCEGVAVIYVKHFLSKVIAYKNFNNRACNIFVSLLFKYFLIVWFQKVVLKM
jgi:hypothetical protein